MFRLASRVAWSEDITITITIILFRSEGYAGGMLTFRST